MTVDAETRARIKKFLEDWLKMSPIVLNDVGVASSWVCFNADCQNGDSMFVKVAIRSYCERTLRFCLRNEDFPLIPKSLVREAPITDLIRFDEPSSVSCLEWKTGSRVDPSDMSVAQVDSLLHGYEELSRRMSAADDVRPILPEDDPDSQYRVCKEYAAHFPLLGKRKKRFALYNAGNYPEYLVHRVYWKLFRHFKNVCERNGINGAG